MSRRRRAGMRFEVAGRLFQCFAGWLAWSGGRHVCIALFHTRCHKTMREDDGVAAASWGRREREDAHGMCASCMHVCICTLAALKNEPSCGSERDWIDCREPETHTDGRMGNKSACSRSTAVGSGGTVDAAKQWRGLSSSLLLNLSIFFLWLTWNPVNTSNALDRAGRERTESPWGCADRFSNPVKSDSSGLA